MMLRDNLEASTTDSSRARTRITRMGCTMDSSSSHTVRWLLARRITVPSDRRRALYRVCSARVEE